MSIDRRDFVGIAAATSLAATASHGAAPAVRRIATEESFSIPEVAGATRALMTSAEGARREPGLAALIAGFEPEQGTRWIRQSLDLGAERRAAMTAARIDIRPDVLDVVHTRAVRLVEQIGIGKGLEADSVRVAPHVEDVAAVRVTAEAPDRLMLARFEPPMRHELRFEILHLEREW